MRNADRKIQNPKSKIQNRESGHLPETFCQLDVSRKSIGGKLGILLMPCISV